MVEHLKHYKGGRLMLSQTTIMDRLEAFANAGDASAQLKLWKKKIHKLRKDGFDVRTISKTERTGEFLCEISWKYPKSAETRYLLSLTISGLNKILNHSLKEAQCKSNK